MKINTHHPHWPAFIKRTNILTGGADCHNLKLLSLALFVFGIFLVDHIEATLSAHNLVFRGTLLD